MKIFSRSKFLVLIPALGAVALLGTAAVAKPGAAAGAAADGKRGGLCAKLGCTDAQRDEVREVMSELRSDSKGDREAVQRLRKQLAQEFAKDKPDEAAMKSIQAKIATHQREMQERRLDAMLEVHALLDAEQRAKLAKAMEHRGMHGKGKRGGKGKGKRGGKGKTQ